MSKLFISIRFVMALLTVLAISAKPFIPQKSLILHPSAATDTAIYGPPTRGGEAGTYWLDKSTHSLRCEYDIQVRSFACGFVVHWGAEQHSDCGKPKSRVHLCSSTVVDPDGDGWSDEDGKTCVMVNEKTGAAVIGHRFCESEESDSDGDGWGWENEQSCIVLAVPLSDSETNPLCADPSSDPDGDGWGWENEQSCRVVKTQDCSSTQNESPESTVIHPSAEGFVGFSVKVHYEGRASYLRLGVVDAELALLAQGKTPKPMSTFLSTEELRAGPVFVDLKQLSVEEWWSIEQNPSRQLGKASFSRIIRMGIDSIEPGIHRIRVDEIRLVGEHISDEAFLLGIAIFWGIYLITESSVRYYHLRNARVHQQAQLESLGDVAKLLEKEKAQLKSRTLTDPLTNVYNRNGFTQRLHELFGTAPWSAGSGLLVLDIDHFKRLNDNYGHDAGDTVLQEFAEIVTSTIRTEDVFARWGGEEFVLLVTHTTPDKLQVIAEKLRGRIAQHHFLPDLPDGGSRVTVSIGVARAEPGESFTQLFKRADTALYEAKNERDKVSYAP